MCYVLLYTLYFKYRLFYYKIVIVFIYFSILSIFLNTYWFIIYLDLGSWIYLSICLSSIYLYIFKPSLARIKRLRWIFVGWDQYSSPPESDLFNGFRCFMFYFILFTLNIVFFIIEYFFLAKFGIFLNFCPFFWMFFFYHICCLIVRFVWLSHITFF